MQIRDFEVKIFDDRISQQFVTHLMDLGLSGRNIWGIYLDFQILTHANVLYGPESHGV